IVEPEDDHREQQPGAARDQIEPPELQDVLSLLFPADREGRHPERPALTLRTSTSSSPRGRTRSRTPCRAAWSRSPCTAVSAGSKSASSPSKLARIESLTRPLMR